MQSKADRRGSSTSTYTYYKAEKQNKLITFVRLNGVHFRKLDGQVTNILKIATRSAYHIV